MEIDTEAPSDATRDALVTAVAFLDLGDRFDQHRQLPPRRLIVRLDALVLMAIRLLPFGAAALP